MYCCQSSLVQPSASSHRDTHSHSKVHTPPASAARTRTQHALHQPHATASRATSKASLKVPHPHMCVPPSTGRESSRVMQHSHRCTQQRPKHPEQHNTERRHWSTPPPACCCESRSASRTPVAWDNAWPRAPCSMLKVEVPLRATAREDVRRRLGRTHALCACAVYVCVLCMCACVVVHMQAYTHSTHRTCVYVC